MAVGHGERELHAPRQPRAQSGEPVPIHGIQFQCIGAVDLLRSQAAREQLGILVRVYRDTRRELGGPVQPRGLGRADIDPNAQGAGEVAHRNRRLVGIGQTIRETDSFACTRGNMRARASAGVRLSPTDAVPRADPMVHRRRGPNRRVRS